mgnify:CR=1 FL=1
MPSPLVVEALREQLVRVLDWYRQNGTRIAQVNAIGNDSRASPTSCRSAYSTFTAGCGWGRLEASSVFTGFDKYLTANEEDVRWALSGNLCRCTGYQNIVKAVLWAAAKMKPAEV